MSISIDLSGKVFGHWTVLKFSHISSGRRMWLCKCDCGEIKPVYRYNLISGKTKSCGCKKGNIKNYIHEHIEQDDNECWNWTEFRDNAGYGVIKFKGVRWRAHRLSYSIFIGPIHGDLLVCHHCDNPSCVNPEHLYLGTSQQNCDDCRERGRTLSGMKHHQAKLSDEEVDEILRLYHEENFTITEIYNMYPQLNSSSTIHFIVKGETWKHRQGK